MNSEQAFEEWCKTEQYRPSPGMRAAWIAADAAATKRTAAECADIAKTMCPSGGRAWTAEQLACWNALTDCAQAIEKEFL